MFVPQLEESDSSFMSEQVKQTASSSYLDITRNKLDNQEKWKQVHQFNERTTTLESSQVLERSQLLPPLSRESTFKLTRKQSILPNKKIIIHRKQKDISNAEQLKPRQSASQKRLGRVELAPLDRRSLSRHSRNSSSPAAEMTSLSSVKTGERKKLMEAVQILRKLGREERKQTMKILQELGSRGEARR